MSAALTATGLTSSTAPVVRRMRAYFAPVDPVTRRPTIFDAAQSGAFGVEAPEPWVDLGWCTGFVRRSGGAVKPIRAGSPGIAQSQVRVETEATVQLEFQSWGKLQLALASGSQQMNLLATIAGAQANGSGGVAAAAVALQTTGGASTAAALNVGAAATCFQAGDVVAVDLDYAGQSGYVGSGVSGGWVRSAADVSNDVNYVRRVTLNVARVASVDGGLLRLGAALPAGVPDATMRVSKVVGFVDREGGTFFQEWSALFCAQGEQGDRLLFHYPRLQMMQSSEESSEVLAEPLVRTRLKAAFRALPTKDENDGAMVLCYRSYLPAPMRSI